MKEEKLLSHFLVFCHRNSILSQWEQSAEQLGLKLEDLDSYQNDQFNINKRVCIFIFYFLQDLFFLLFICY